MTQSGNWLVKPVPIRFSETVWQLIGQACTNQILRHSLATDWSSLCQSDPPTESGNWLVRPLPIRSSDTVWKLSSQACNVLKHPIMLVLWTTPTGILNWMLCYCMNNRCLDILQLLFDFVLYCADNGDLHTDTLDGKEIPHYISDWIIDNDWF